MNFDSKLLKYRSDLYQRHNYFITQSLKHFTKKCECKKKNKRCHVVGEVDLNRFGDPEYLSQLYTSGTFDTIYNICQSITQSMRCKSGKDFESCLEKILIEEGFQKDIHYSTQVYITKGMTFSFKKHKDSHTIDFVIPSPLEGMDVNNFKGEIISSKTTLRERWLQDKYIPNFTLISLEQKQCDGVKCIWVKPNGNELDIWLNNIKKKFLHNKKMNVLDLFCGCGGLTQGLTDAGLNVVLGIDKWDKAIESYQKNFHHKSLCVDISEFPPLECKNKFELENIDIIVGGPPCQGFSMAGRRDNNDPRNSLFMEYVKYLDFFQPNMFLFENVMGILSMKTQDDKKSIDIIMEQLGINYNCILTKLYASDFQVPQNRRRVIIIGIHKKFNVIPDEPSKIIKNKIDRIPISSVLEEKESIDSSYFLSEKAILGIQNKKERMQKEGKGFGAQFIHLDKPCFTIPARYWKDGYDALVKYSESEIRRLTIKELKRIQSFPDTYILCGSNKEQITQIGNAVPCKFAFHLGKHLMKLYSKCIS